MLSFIFSTFPCLVRTCTPLPNSSALHRTADADRFHTDTAGEAKKQRDDRAAAAKALTDQKRAVRIVGEEQRWEAFEQRDQAEADRWNAIRADEKNTMARRNNISVPYNPISLQYNDTLDGLRMQYADNMVKYRGEVRSLTLQKLGNGSANPITGAPLPYVPNPQLPAKTFQDRPKDENKHTHMFGH